ncbi:MAG TPA: PilN domain-containing protein [Gaiellaceae bacterium]|jgi:Tfp pilus assembly protein PilN
MRAVNLLPRQQVEQKRERTNTVGLVAGIGGAAVLLALVGGFLLANRSVDRQRQALTDAKAMLAATPAKKISAKTQAFRSTLLSQREERGLALAAGLGKRVSWDRILSHVALVMPDDVWFTKVNGTVPVQTAAPTTATAAATGPSALPPTPTEFTIIGQTYSQASVARFLERLQVDPDLKNVQLQTSVPDQTNPVVDFTIVANVRKGRGAS